MPGKDGVRVRDRNQTIVYPAAYRKNKGAQNYSILAPPSVRVYKGRQETVSTGHKRTNGAYYEGGPFFTCLIQPRVQTRRYSFEGNRGDGVFLKYAGPIKVPGISQTNLSGFSMPTKDDSYLDQHGATAIKLVDPTNANANLGVALGEVAKDGLSVPGYSTWKDRTKVAKAAGSEYLSAVFGWLPLVSDISDTRDSIRQRNVILKGYRDNAGKNVRRSFAFDDEVSSSESILYPFARAEMAGGQTGFEDKAGKTVPVTVHSETTVRRWFSGAFTYASPDRDDRIGRMLGIDSEFDKLFGLSLTPEILWELTPWSWAADWFSNAGDVVHNITSFKLGGLVMRYGYIMEETSTKHTYSMPSAALLGDDGAVPTSSVTYTVKRRREANPFGFGLSWDGLSPSQMLITAALGITRLR